MATRAQVWLARWRNSQLALPSDLSPDEACGVIRADLVRWMSMRVSFGESEWCVVGSADPDRVRLVALQPWDTNSFRPVFGGRVDAHDEGCVLVGALGPPRFIQVFGVLWVTILAAALTVGCAVTVYQLAVGDRPYALFVVAFAFLMLAFFVALAEFAGRAGDRDAAYLRAWLETRLSTTRDPAA